LFCSPFLVFDTPVHFWKLDVREVQKQVYVLRHFAFISMFPHTKIVTGEQYWLLYAFINSYVMKYGGMERQELDGPYK
jgi:hypothetical protein